MFGIHLGLLWDWAGQEESECFIYKFVLKESESQEFKDFKNTILVGGVYKILTKLLASGLIGEGSSFENLEFLCWGNNW